MPYRVLLVDDEPVIVRIYQIALRDRYDVEIATDPIDALELVRQKGPFAIVVSDMQMPGMNGIELISKIRDLHKQTVGILLTAHTDATTAIRAINEGDVFRFVDKAGAGEMLEHAIESAIVQHDLLTAESELLSNTLSGGVRMLIQVLSLAMPEAFGLAQEAKSLSRALAERLDAEPLWQIEMAAMLMRVGCVALPQDVLRSYLRCEKLTLEQRKLVADTPKMGHQLVSAIPRLEGVSELIRHQQDPPTEAPLGSRILRVIDDFQRLQRRSRSLMETLQQLQDESTYDLRVVQQLADIVSVDRAHKFVTVDELRAGMILESHILKASDSGIIVVQGTEVHAALIQKLRMLQRDGVTIQQPISVVFGESEEQASENGDQRQPQPVGIE